MSLYNFAPIASHHQNHPFITWDNGFTEDELQKIIDYCDTLPKEEGVTGVNDKINSIRKCEVSWVKNENDISWAYDRLGFIARKINSQFYNFDLSGFVEDFQYTIYNGNNDHYGWHNDMGNTSISPRKLTLVLQLSDPSEYEGGELQSFIGPQPSNVDKKKGMIAAFPSWTLHQVAPVTKGVRKTLVIWVAGPQFI